MTHRTKGDGRNRLIAALPAAARSRLAPLVDDFTLVRGAVLQEQGERTEHVYFPNTGMISLLAVLNNGEAIETATVGSEGAVGTLMASISQRALSRALVQVSGTASRIPTVAFRRA